jgi:hypothetical protein
MKQYQLYVKVEQHWKRLCSLRAKTHPEAMKKALSYLEPKYANHRIRLEQEEMEVIGELLDVETQELPDGPEFQTSA